MDQEVFFDYVLIKDGSVFITFLRFSAIAINFGMALPKWMIKKENTLLVVGVYALIFLLMLPIVVVRSIAFYGL